MAKQQFQTEVSQLLHLIIHSLYSHKEIFLRELVSNASDALDKLKYLTVTEDAYKSLDYSPRIDISFDDEGATTLTISDNGIGMNEQELADHLGTIACSGTRSFMETLTGDAAKDASLIGRFGVGFYSSFMVADKVDVVSKRVGESLAWRWSSDGKGDFEIEAAEKDGWGTTITLHLNDEGKGYANRGQLEQIIQKYSNHIPYPIFLSYQDKEYDMEAKEYRVKGEKTEQVNTASALWRRPKHELDEEKYTEFYHAISHDTEDPLCYVHTRAEGTQEYVTLFYVPKKAPFDLYRADYKAGVKLYVKRVFIMDDNRELLPSYLRFVRGIIDSDDLPLNVSREILQQNRVLTAISRASVKKLLGEFKKLSEVDTERYTQFIEEYNRPLKEGLFTDYENRDTLLELIRFKSTTVDGWTSLAAYQQRMSEEQKAIYYITGGKEETLRNSPLLGSYHAKGIEVLIMADDIDDIVISHIPMYKDLELKAINKSGSLDDLKSEEDKEREKEVTPLLARIKEILVDRVKDVVASSRLTDMPSCIVADQDEMSVHMQQMLKAMGQQNLPDWKPILEINPNHDLLRRLQNKDDRQLLEDVSFILLDQALMMDGVEITAPNDFVKRLNRVMLSGL